jgi:RimJ/RimL family protein N-acetyltransferase
MFFEITRDDVYCIETPRLWLRWPRAADGEALTHYLADFDVVKMTARIPHPYPPEEAQRFIVETRRGNVEGQHLGLMIAPNADPHRAIGAITLTPDDDPSRLILGYWLGKPHWGQGLASEAVSAIIAATFTLSRALQIVASVRIINPASRRVLERNGFRHTHDDEPFAPARGERHAVHWFALDRGEWFSRSTVVYGKTIGQSVALPLS